MIIKKVLIFISFLIFISANLLATDPAGYAVVFVKGNSTQLIYKNMNRDSFVKIYKDLFKKGYGIVDMDSASVIIDSKSNPRTTCNGGICTRVMSSTPIYETRYVGVFAKRTSGEKAFIGHNKNFILKKHKELFPQGWRIHRLSVCCENNKVLYSVVFKRMNSGEVGVFDLTRNQIVKETNKHYKKGNKIAQIDSYQKNGVNYFTAFYQPNNTGESARFTITMNAMKNEINQHGSIGFVIDTLSCTDVPGNNKLYSATFRRRQKEQREELYIRSDDLFNVKKNMKNAGYIIKDIEMFNNRGLM